MPTKQETFDTVVAHLRKQGRKAVGFYGLSGKKRCVYRSDDGLKCAVGCLIQDESYVDTFEGQGVTKHTAVGDLLIGLGYDDYLLRRLQGVHDACDTELWEEELENVAKEFGLTYAPPAATAV